MEVSTMPLSADFLRNREGVMEVINEEVQKAVKRRMTPPPEGMPSAPSLSLKESLPAAPKAVLTAGGG